MCDCILARSLQASTILRSSLMGHHRVVQGKTRQRCQGVMHCCITAAGDGGGEGAGAGRHHHLRDHPQPDALRLRPFRRPHHPAARPRRLLRRPRCVWPRAETGKSPQGHGALSCRHVLDPVVIPFWLHEARCCHEPCSAAASASSTVTRPQWRIGLPVHHSSAVCGARSWCDSRTRAP